MPKPRSHALDSTAHRGQTESLWEELKESLGLTISYRAALAAYKRDHDRQAGGLCACPLCRLAGPLLGIE